MEQKLLERPLPVQWGNGSRGFWTKRKKTAGSIFAILALIAGIAAAFLLFDRTVPNNVVREASRFDYEVHVLRSNGLASNPLPGDTGNEPGYCNTVRATIGTADTGDDAAPQPSPSPAVAEIKRDLWCHAGGFGGAEEPIFEAGVSTYPGDTGSSTRRTEEVRIYNTNKPAREATIWMYVKDIVVTRCQDGTLGPSGWDPNTPNGTSSDDVINEDEFVASTTDPVSGAVTPAKVQPRSDKGQCRGTSGIVVPDSTTKTAFLNFWQLTVLMEKVASVAAGTDIETELNENAHNGGRDSHPSGTTPDDDAPNRADHDGVSGSQTKTVCEGPIRGITLSGKCNLGMVEGNGARDTGGQNTDVRWYSFRITQADPGTDQSAFMGWTANFVFAFQAQVPAVAESTTGER